MSVDGSKQEQAAAQRLLMVNNATQTATPASIAPNNFAIWMSGFSEASVNSFCGALAGVASGVVTCPLDVIKTKLQAQGGFRPRTTTGTIQPSYRGMVPTARLIWTQDGFVGMYRGLGPMLIGYLPTWAVYMGVYGTSRDYYYTKIDSKALAQMAASVTAGACSTLATNPIWVVKTRLMSQVGAAASKENRTPWHYKNTLDAFRQMYAMEGWRAFYSGLAPALLGLSHVAIQFPLYEYFKYKFTGLEMGDNHSKDSHWLGILGATFLSKVCATTATYPHEVLRTRLQTQQRHHMPSVRSTVGPLRSHGVSPPITSRIKDAAKQITGPITSNTPRYVGVLSSFNTILREEGWRAFYHGMGTNLFRAVPSAMTTMLTFESLKRLIQNVQEQGREAA